jgi:hypothetical protein
LRKQPAIHREWNNLYARGPRILIRSSRELATEEKMKITLNIVGAILVLFGIIWFLQGISVLPGSFMTGQIRWAVYGGIAVAVGIAFLLAAKRRRLDGGR